MTMQVATMRRISLSMLLFVTVFVLAGCMYPKDRLAQNQAPPREAVRSVQAAIDEFLTERGTLPIKNAEADTPRYEKFMIDFAKLKRMNYMSDMPAAAYERGGSYYFVVQREETKPTVKLMSVVVYQQLVDLQAKVDGYIEGSGGGLPVSGEAYPSFYHLDMKKLGGVKPDIRSVFSNQPLNVIVHESGKVFGDYGIDVRHAALEAEASPESYDDLRELLVDESLYVPVKSPAYVWRDGDPVAVLPSE